MSIHVEISDEVKQRLAQQRRNSTISSLLIALLSIVLIGFVLAFIALKVVIKDVDAPIAYVSSRVEEQVIKSSKVTDTVVRKPSAPSSVQNKVISAIGSSSLAVPTVDVDFTEPAVDFGDGDDFGLGAGDELEAIGDGGVTGIIPTILRKRCSLQDRLQRLKEAGGTEECETAVVKALDWLKGTQKADGSWDTAPYDVGMTSLALLTYLGHCETGASREYGATVDAAIGYLINVGLKQDGKLGTSLRNKHWPYEHAIAVYALSEALSLSRGFSINIPNIEEVIQKAGQVLIDGQHERTGGWDYEYVTDTKRGGDSSLTGWHVQALKAMDHTGITFNGLASAEKDALEYLEDLQAPSGGLSYATLSPNDNQVHGKGITLGAVGALSFQIMGKGNSSVVRKAIKIIDKEMVLNYNDPAYDLYGHYYAAQAMLNEGGAEWDKFNKGTRDILLAAQQPNGAWKQPWGSGGKPVEKGEAVAASYGYGKYALHYRTCLAALTLETYYRFLPSAKK